jgi:2-polyprenyl-6-methoxyphenol hydroxylase-like FAD-dependent oxidoreductase
VGLSAALLLAQRGYRDIRVLEKASSAVFDSEKSYLYLIDGRGQRLTDRLGLRESIASRAVSSKAFQNITEFDTKGKLTTKPVPVDPQAIEKFWLPRSALMTVLQEQLRKWDGVIKVYYNTSCTGVTLYDTDGGFDREKDRGMILVESQGGDSASSECFDADLLLGCDGIASVVRRSLEQHFRSPDKQQSKDGPFALTTIESDAAGLNYKMLPLRYRFGLTKNPDGTWLQSEPEKAYVIP